MGNKKAPGSSYLSYLFGKDRNRTHSTFDVCDIIFGLNKVGGTTYGAITHAWKYEIIQSATGMFPHAVMKNRKLVFELSREAGYMADDDERFEEVSAIAEKCRKQIRYDDVRKTLSLANKGEIIEVSVGAIEGHGSTIDDDRPDSRAYNVATLIIKSQKITIREGHSYGTIIHITLFGCDVRLIREIKYKASRENGNSEIARP